VHGGRGEKHRHRLFHVVAGLHLEEQIIRNGRPEGPEEGRWKRFFLTRPFEYGLSATIRIIGGLCGQTPFSSRFPKDICIFQAGRRFH